MADGPSTQSWVRLLRLMTPHTHLEGRKRFTAYETEVSEASRAGLSSRSEIAWEDKERRLAQVFIEVRGWGQGEGSHTWMGLVWFESPASAKREHQAFFYQLVHMWNTSWEETVRLKSYPQSTIKENGAKFYIPNTVWWEVLHGRFARGANLRWAFNPGEAEGSKVPGEMCSWVNHEGWGVREC